MSLRSVRLLVATVIALAGACQCFPPTYITCQNDLECPTGYFCQPSMFCGKNQPPGDAGVSADAGTSLDAGESAGVDAGPMDAGDGGPEGDGGPGDAGDAGERACTSDTECLTGWRCCSTDHTCHEVVSGDAGCDCAHPCPMDEACLPGLCGESAARCRPGCFPGSTEPAPDGTPPATCGTQSGENAFCSPLPASMATPENDGGACVAGDSCDLAAQNCGNRPLDESQPQGASNPLVPYNCVPAATSATACIPAGSLEPGITGCGLECGTTTGNCVVGAWCVRETDRAGTPIGPATCSAMCSLAPDAGEGQACPGGASCVPVYGVGGDRFPVGACDSFADGGSVDGGPDVGPFDAGSDAGLDGGPRDAGSGSGQLDADPDAGITDAGTADAGAAHTGADGGCGANEISCVDGGVYCANPADDPENCGGCGIVCPAIGNAGTPVCSSRTCSAPCKRIGTSSPA